MSEEVKNEVSVANSAANEEERQALKVAEASREKDWKHPSFLKELFLGNFRFDLIDPFPEVEERPEFMEFYNKFKSFMIEKVNSMEIDRTGEYPQEVIDGLAEMGAFGMKIPKKYGGLGFTQAEYDRVMKLLGSVDGNVTALLSAHQSIGVPSPLKTFGTEEQKELFLPRCAKGAISAFALTEAQVGSDPSSLKTTATLTPEGDAYIINGEKLWCTNGTLAELLVVMTCDPETKKISTFIVDTKTEGVKVERRCYFMGLKALANAVISFTNVRVPVVNRVGKEGEGLKIALVTLNTGRLALPATCSGTVKVCMEMVRKWSNERVQWGFPVGKHEAIAHKLSDMASTSLAMESVSQLSSRLSDKGGYDIRLEAAAAKEWNTCRGWEIVDDTMQIRGGRGYETAESLLARGEKPYGIEMIMRDSRINRIFEGSSEIMHLFIAREALDKHLQVAGALIDPKQSFGKKFTAFWGAARFYSLWYPGKWLGWGYWPKYNGYGKMARHLRFAERASRKLAREMFHGMMLFGPKMSRKQGFLFRAVDIGLELYAMSATISRVTQMKKKGSADYKKAETLAEMFCRNARRKIRKLFHDLWHNDDKFKTAVSKGVLEGDHKWFESEGVLSLERLDSLVETSEEKTREPQAV